MYGGRASDDACIVPILSVDSNGRVREVRTITVNAISAITGDITINKNNGSVVARLANTGVTEGTYGGSSLIPQLSVDSKGRILGIKTNPVTFEGSNATFNYIKANRLVSGAVVQTSLSPSISGGRCTLDLSKSNIFTINVDQPITTFLLVNHVDGSMNIVLKIYQKSGSPVKLKFDNKIIRWANGVEPTVTTKVANIDVYTFFTFDGLEWFGGTLGQGYK